MEAAVKRRSAGPRERENGDRGGKESARVKTVGKTFRRGLRRKAAKAKDENRKYKSIGENQTARSLAASWHIRLLESTIAESVLEAPMSCLRVARLGNLAKSLGGHNGLNDCKGGAALPRSKSNPRAEQ